MKTSEINNTYRPLECDTHFSSAFPPPLGEGVTAKYLKNGYICDSDLSNLAKLFNLTKEPEGFRKDIYQAIHYYIYPLEAKAANPKISETSKAILPLQKSLEKIVKQLDEIATSKDQAIVAAIVELQDNYKFKFNELKNISSTSLKAINSYKQDNRPQKGAPPNKAIKDFIFVLGLNYKELTKEAPSCYWNEYDNCYDGQFLTFCNECLKLLKKEHHLSNNSLGQHIKSIEHFLKYQ